MYFEYKDMVVSTVSFFRMASKTEQETDKTTETTETTEKEQTTEIKNPSIPQTTEVTTEDKTDEELIKEYKSYMKSVQLGIGDSVMVTTFCGVGIYILCGLTLALILSRYLKAR
ncbi:hypothetical protein [Anaerostipes sp.]|uniref:hypothetical protein n=1 Tax=Anaerostipes sp. TaxID=1872530 RepID=UPI0025BD4CB9|nr:hypothetical protein [Anaerostipes sp.]MBS7007567.1 hypothetical protein [Anaerostipes sp.]